ncbi:MAG: NADH-quinone oxidoreductase subunit I [Planctomycetes bacterium]|jgi:NADH-quinone oxidoreductase subunit I|nr:NADH-quinone oxidoreductase subunit I [Planctomycetota bacterium]
MAYRKVERPALTLGEKLYLPAILKGLGLTLKHFFKRKKFTRQYPEEPTVVPEGYRGLPVLVKDDEGRVKCVACQMCEWVCPPEAIRIIPEELAVGNTIEKGPREFDLDTLRCIFCGLCEEACPEEAIFLSDKFEFAGGSREEMIFHKEKLLDLGGVRAAGAKKWKKEGNAGFHREGPIR